MPYCPSCGDEIGKSDKYCDQCGMLIDVSSTPFPKKIQSMRYVVVGLGLFLIIVGIFVFSIMPSGQSTAGSPLSQQGATGQVIAEQGGSSVGGTVTTSTITVTTLPPTTSTTTTTTQPTTTTTIAGATTTTIDCSSAAISIDQVYLTSGSQGSARAIVRNSGNTNDLSITSAELHNTIGNVYSVSTPQIPIKDFDKGEAFTLTFDNINVPTCSSFSKVVVTTNCASVTAAFAGIPMCTNPTTTTTLDCSLASITIEAVYLTSGSDGSARAVVRNSGQTNDLSITSAQLYTSNGNNYTVSSPTMPIQNFDRGNAMALTFVNINAPVCPSSFSMVVVQTNCAGTGDTFSSTPQCA